MNSDVFFFFSSRRRHTRLQGDWSSDVCSSDLSSFVEADSLVDCEMLREIAYPTTSRGSQQIRYLHPGLLGVRSCSIVAIPRFPDSKWAGDRGSLMTIYPSHAGGVAPPSPSGGSAA